MNAIALISFFLMFTTQLADAREPWHAAVLQHIDPVIAALRVPPFCEGISGNKDIPSAARYKNINWKQKFGEDFIWINHYCDQKPKHPICYEYPENEKRACLTTMLEGPTYALEHAKSPDYALIPFLRSERAILLRDIGKPGDAISDFEIAIKNNPKFIPAYTGLTDTYISLKQYDDAKKTIERALAHNPNTKSLQKKLEKINSLQRK